jgi:hypothetical protein
MTLKPSAYHNPPTEPERYPPLWKTNWDLSWKPKEFPSKFPSSIRPIGQRRTDSDLHTDSRTRPTTGALGSRQPEGLICHASFKKVPPEGWLRWDLADALVFRWPLHAVDDPDIDSLSTRLQFEPDLL